MTMTIRIFLRNTFKGKKYIIFLYFMIINNLYDMFYKLYLISNINYIFILKMIYLTY